MRYKELCLLPAMLWVGWLSAEQRVQLTLQPAPQGVPALYSGAICSGVLEGDANLGATGITRQELQQGVGCVSGDYDGNGSADFVLYRSKDIENGARVLVVLTVKSEVLKTLAPEHRFYLPPQTYRAADPRVQRAISSFQCPRPERDGIVDWGEGGGSDIYLWDAQLQDFVGFTCRSEDA